LHAYTKDKKSFRKYPTEKTTAQLNVAKSRQSYLFDEYKKLYKRLKKGDDGEDGLLSEYFNACAKSLNMTIQPVSRESHASNYLWKDNEDSSGTLKGNLFYRQQKILIKRFEQGVEALRQFLPKKNISDNIKKNKSNDIENKNDKANNIISVPVIITNPGKIDIYSLNKKQTTIIQIIILKILLNIILLKLKLMMKFTVIIFLKYTVSMVLYLMKHRIKKHFTNMKK
jgi:hypothetical protein